MTQYILSFDGGVIMNGIPPRQVPFSMPITIAHSDEDIVPTDNIPDVSIEMFLEESRYGLAAELSSDEITGMIHKYTEWFSGICGMGRVWNWKCSVRGNYRKLFISERQMLNFTKCLADPNIKIVFAFIQMTQISSCSLGHVDEEAHIAVLMVKKDEDNAWLIDPSGRAVYRRESKGLEWFEQLSLLELLQALIGRPVIIPASCSGFGPQSTEISLQDESGEITHGYCASWALLIIFFSLYHHGQSMDIAMNILTQMPAEKSRDLIHGWTVWVRKMLNIENVRGERRKRFEDDTSRDIFKKRPLVDHEFWAQIDELHAILDGDDDLQQELQDDIDLLDDETQQLLQNDIGSALILALSFVGGMLLARN